MTVSSSTLPAGSRIGGKYVIEKKLGEGGMGAVFLAENVDIGRKVAIKVLHADYAANPDLIKRFRLEARAAAAIGHPGIVDVLDMGTTDDGSAFIVMERLDGETLGARVENQGRLPVKTACLVVADVLDALAAAHDKHIIHRDLKPDNVFLVERPVALVKILDFGISKLQGSEDVSLTRTGAVMGTPLYMSPEQARGARDVGSSADLYSVGAILYHVLGGGPPFTGDSYNEVLAKVLMEPHRPLGEVRPGLPAKLVALVDALLDKSPSLRPDARAAGTTLRQIAAQLTNPREALDATMAAGPATAPQRVAPGPSTPPPDVPVAGVSEVMVASEGGALPAPTQPGQREAPAAPTVVGGGRKVGLWIGGAAAVAAAGVAVLLLGGKEQKAPVAELPAPPVPALVEKPAPPPLAPPPASEKITVKLSAAPAAARWWLDGEPLGCNPCEVVRDKGVKATAEARAEGFVAATVELDFQASEPYQVELVAVKAKPTVRPTAKPPPVVTKPPEPAETKPGGLTIDPQNPFKKP